MKTWKTIFLAVIITYICVAGTTIAYFQFEKKIFERELLMDVVVSDIYGFNIDIDALYFGQQKPGGVATRKINLTNIFGMPASVEISVDDSEMSSWVGVEDNNILIPPGESKIVKVYINVPLNTALGRYNGNMYITYNAV